MTTDDIIKQAVDKFLPWKLPQNFYPDSFISFDAKKHDTWGGYPNSWPTGTNLFTSEQAKEMFEHCIRAAVEGMAQELEAAKETIADQLDHIKDLLRTQEELKDSGNEAANERDALKRELEAAKAEITDVPNLKSLIYIARKERDALQSKLDASEKQESIYVDRACYERGCACYDPRVDKDPVLVVQPAPRPDHAKLIARLRGFSIPDIGPVGICDEAADALEALGKTPT